MLADWAQIPCHGSGEAEYRKLLTRALRYFAHANGASLISTKQKDKQMLGVRSSPTRLFAEDIRKSD